jgi:hypothetical protein
LDILVREVELLLSGSPLRDSWTNHGVVRPLARAIADGKVFRSSPQFSFAFIKIAGVQYKLGDDVQALLEDGSQQLCKISSIFLHTSPNDCKEDVSVAVYVQLYENLAELDGTTSAIRKAKQKARGRELVLNTQEVLLKGQALNIIKRKVVIVEEPCDFSSRLKFLCRYVLEDQTFRKIRDVHRHPTQNFDHSTLFANLAAAEKEGLEVIRVFIQIYLDAFPILASRKNVSSNGIYISFGNLDHDQLQKLDNYFCIGHFPKGVDKHECFTVWIKELVRIQDGFR